MITPYVRADALSSADDLVAMLYAFGAVSVVVGVAVIFGAAVGRSRG